jgi:hypothetical protein
MGLEVGKYLNVFSDVACVLEIIATRAIQNAQIGLDGSKVCYSLCGEWVAKWIDGSDRSVAKTKRAAAAARKMANKIWMAQAAAAETAMWAARGSESRKVAVKGIEVEERVAAEFVSVIVEKVMEWAVKTAVFIEGGGLKNCSLKPKILDKKFHYGQGIEKQKKGYGRR